MNKTLNRAAFAISASALGMHLYNQYIDMTACSRNLLHPLKGKYYNWKTGKVFYTKLGTGSPILLIHDINAISCSKEWTGIRKLLAKDHTVYTFDLPGCGRSDKPALKYTGNLFINLTRDFIKDIIGGPTDVVASNNSVIIPVLGSQLYKDLFHNIILINPQDLEILAYTPNKLAQLCMPVLNSPLFGTFIYNITSSLNVICDLFENNFFYNRKAIPSGLPEAFYEAAHLSHGKGKYLQTSIITNYSNLDLLHILPSVDKKITILASMDLISSRTLERYTSGNDNFAIIPISRTALYPHIEAAEEVADLIDDLTY